MRPQSLYLARPRRLCQPPWTQSISRKPHPLSGGTSSEEAPNSNASRSSGERGLGGEGLLSEKPPLPPEFPTSSYSACPRRLCQPPWTHASLSKIRLTSGGTKLEAINPAKRQPLFGREREGGASLREAASLAYPHFRSALRERGSGGEALLTEKRPLPQSSPRPSLLCRNFFACVE